MKNIVKEIPTSLNEDSAISLLDELWEERDISFLTLDFSYLNFVYPFGTLILAEGIKDLVRYRNKQKYKTRLRPCDKIDSDTSSALSYLKYFNFFEYIDAPCGRDKLTGTTDRGYIPIIKLEKDNIIDLNQKAPFQENIESMCKSYAESLVQARNEMLEQTITYCYREVIRNTFEHAEVDNCVIMAQNWWKNNELEIALIDRGIGILGTIQKQHKVSIVEDAIDLALKPGVSGKTIIENDDIWGNSGFGLYVLSELGAQFGSFSIYSSGVLVKLRKESISRKHIQIGGTGIKLRLSFDKIDVDYFPNIKEKIVSEGEKLYEHEFGKPIKASKGSRS